MGLRITGAVVVLGAAVWLLTRGAEERPPPAVTWSGAQVEQVGDALRLRFTAKRPPRVRILEPVNSVDRAPPTLALRRDTGPIMIPLRADTLDGIAVWTADPPAIEAGPGVLALSLPGHAPAVQPIVWGAIPTRDVAPSAIPALPIPERAGAWLTRARAHMRQGEVAKAADAYLDAAKAADAAGQISEAARFRRAAVHQLMRLGRVDAARALLAEAEAASAAVDDALGLALAAKYRARLAQVRGDSRASARHFERAAELAAKAGDRRLFDKFRVLGAVQMQYAGRHAEAIRRIAAITNEPVLRDEGARARLSANEAWVRLRAAAQGAVPMPGPVLVKRLQAARDFLLASGAIADAANFEDNLAMLYLLQGNLDAARTQLTARQARGVPGNDPWFVDLLDARIALAAGQLDGAQAAFSRVVAVEDAPPEYRWRAHFGRGQVALARGDRRRARAHIDAALVGMATQARMTAIDTSRAAFFADHRALVEAAVELAITDDRLTDAFAIIDADRARITRALDLGRRLQRVDAEARARLLDDRAAFEAMRRDGELQVDRAAWASRRAQTAAALRARFDGLVAQAHAPDARPDLAALKPDERVVSAWRQGTARVVLMAHRGGVERVDAWPPPLPARGHVYVVDSPDAETLTTAVPAGWTVSRVPFAGWLAQRDPRPVTGAPVVLGDPDGTLPLARAEAREVAAALSVTPMPRAEANPRALLTRLQRTRLFHFAGHGVLTTADPFDAHLRLAEGTRLSLEDVLVARPRVGLAVLSGCETGKRGALAGEHALGLAHAFLVAGADRVLAANTAVPDAAARDFMRAFHAANGARDPAEALRVVQPSGGPWRMWGRR